MTACLRQPQPLKGRKHVFVSGPSFKIGCYPIIAGHFSGIENGMPPTIVNAAARAYFAAYGSTEYISVRIQVPLWMAGKIHD